jgi:hypothetical protein
MKFEDILYSRIKAVIQESEHDRNEYATELLTSKLVALLRELEVICLRPVR